MCQIDKGQKVRFPPAPGLLSVFTHLNQSHSSMPEVLWVSHCLLHIGDQSSSGLHCFSPLQGTDVPSSSHLIPKTSWWPSLAPRAWTAASTILPALCGVTSQGLCFIPSLSTPSDMVFTHPNGPSLISSSRLCFQEPPGTKYHGAPSEGIHRNLWALPRDRVSGMACGNHMSKGERELNLRVVATES